MDFSYPFGIDKVFVLIACIIIIFFLVTLMQKNLRFKIFILPVFLMMLLAFGNMDASPYMFVLLCAYMFHNSTIKKWICFSVILRSVFVLITLYLLQKGYVSDTVTSGIWKNTANLHTLGFSGNPNTTSSYFFSFTIFLYIGTRLIKNKYIGFFLDILNICIFVSIYFYTRSRSFFIAGIILYLCGLFFRKKKNILVSIGIFTPLILFFLSFVIMLILSENKVLNLLLSFRPRLFNKAFMLLDPLKLFVGSKTDVLIDNSYLKIFFNTGLIGSLFFIYIYVKFSKRMLLEDKFWNKNYFYMPAIISLASIGFTESILAAVKDITILFYIVIFSVYQKSVRISNNTSEIS